MTIRAPMIDRAPDVLIIADEQDYHALGVLRAVEDQGGSALILNNRDFPGSVELVHGQTQRGVTSTLTLADGRRVRLDELAGLWWRRPQKYQLDPALLHPSLRAFAHDECREAFLGSLIASVGNFVNPVGHSRFATHKLGQLEAARALGLRVPPTLVTNDPARIRAFAEEHPRTIYKTFTGCDFGFYETRALDDGALADIDRIKLAPVIVQRFVPGNRDIRVTVVGEEVFAAELHLDRGRHPTDGRIDRVPIYRHDLPAAIAAQMVALTRHFGLVYSTIDLRLDDHGCYSFFELNPEGQFLWVEIEARLGICDALARRLLARTQPAIRPAAPPMVAA